MLRETDYVSRNIFCSEHAALKTEDRYERFLFYTYVQVFRKRNQNVLENYVVIQRERERKSFSDLK